MTRTIYALFIASIFVLSTPITYALGDIPPTYIRFGIIKRRLDKLAECKDGETCLGGRLMQRCKTFVLRWKLPKNESGQVLANYERIVSISVDSLKDKLPNGLGPEAARLLCVGKIFVERNGAPSFWVWIAEFQIDDETYSAGTGFAQTLLVPISVGGQCLSDVEK